MAILIESAPIPAENIVRGSVRGEPTNNYSGLQKAYKNYGLKHDDCIAWFANKYNKALGWIIYKASDFDKREFGKDIFRTYSEQTNTVSIIKLNIFTGTYAFIDNEAYVEGDIIFDRMSKYDRIVIEPTQVAYDEFNIF